MPSINFIVESKASDSIRRKQLEAIFDMPIKEKIRHEYSVNLPYEEKDWNVGLICGHSGSGKTQIAKNLYGDNFEKKFIFNKDSVIDDFNDEYSIEEITDTCSAVGFNTIPSWLKPYSVLSNGEQFRVKIARCLLETKGTIIIDEFTSVVDRQVAKITSHAVQKYVRKKNKQFIGISCHYDIIEWLQPDWILDMNSNTFQWRLLRRRPTIQCEISPVDYAAWRIFAPYHYMSKELLKNARCFGIFINNNVVGFAGIIYRPQPRNKNNKNPVYGVQRLVTLPDYQGIGIAFVLVNTIGSIYKALNKRLRTYPAHPSLIRSFYKSNEWELIKRPGYSNRNITSSNKNLGGHYGGRPNAVFEYVGEAMDKIKASQIMEYWRQKTVIQR